MQDASQVSENVARQNTGVTSLRHTVTAVKTAAQNALAEAEGRESNLSMGGGEDGMEDVALFGFRNRVRRLINSFVYQCTLNTCIVFHIGLAVYQTDQRAAGNKAATWERMVEPMLTALYLGDILLRIVAHRLSFFCEKLSLLDFFIVLVDVSFMLMEFLTGNSAKVGPVSQVRALRAIRVIRVIRNFSAFRDLYLMMKGMLGALRAILFATLLILGVLTLFSIMAVELIDPLNKQLADNGTYPDCERCPRAFSSVMSSNLTFLTSIIAGDSWGKIAVPLLETYPWTGTVIVSAFITVELGLLNVIVAVVVDRQAQAREEDKALQSTMKEEQAKSSYKELVSLFKTMDEDGSGTLTLKELQTSFDDFEDFREMLRCVDITRQDLETIFASMDADEGGVVDYEEFTRELHHLRTLDIRTLMYLTRQHVIEAKRASLDVLERFDKLLEVAANTGIADARKAATLAIAQVKKPTEHSKVAKEKERERQKEEKKKQMEEAEKKEKYSGFDGFYSENGWGFSDSDSKSSRELHEVVAGDLEGARKTQDISDGLPIVNQSAPAPPPAGMITASGAQPDFRCLTGQGSGASPILPPTVGSALSSLAPVEPDRFCQNSKAAAPAGLHDPSLVEVQMEGAGLEQQFREINALVAQTAAMCRRCLHARYECALAALMEARCVDAVPPSAPANHGNGVKDTHDVQSTSWALPPLYEEDGVQQLIAADDLQPGEEFREQMMSAATPKLEPGSTADATITDKGFVSLAAAVAPAR